MLFFRRVYYVFRRSYSFISHPFFSNQTMLFSILFHWQWLFSLILLFSILFSVF